MPINKVVYGTDTLIDITDSTVTAETLAEGEVAYNAAGERIEGMAVLDKKELFYIPVDETDLTDSVQSQSTKEGVLTSPYTFAEIYAQHQAGKRCAVLLSNTEENTKDMFLPLTFSGDGAVGSQGWCEHTYFDYGASVAEPTPMMMTVSVVQQSNNTTKVYVTKSPYLEAGNYLPLSGGTMTGNIVMGSNSVTGLGTPINDTDAVTKRYLDNATTILQSQIDALGEPFRLKDFQQTFSTAITIPSITTDIANTSIPNVDITISGTEAENFAVASLAKYEVKDASGNRLNCVPVCMFSMDGQKTLRVRMMVAGPNSKSAKSIAGAMLLKHR